MPISVRWAAGGSGDNATHAVVTRPAGQTTSEGDYLLAVSASDRDGNLAAMTAAGFTELAPFSGTRPAPFVKVWSKVAGASEPSSYTFQDATGSNGSAIVLAITGHDPATPLAVTPVATVSPTASASHIAPSVTGVADGLLVTAHIGETDGTSRSYTGTPTGMTKQVETALASGGWVVLGAFTQLLADAGATGTRTATCSASVPHTALSLVIAPATGTSPGTTASFGKTTDGASTTSSSTNKISVSTATPTSSGTLTAGHARVWLSAAGTSNTRLVVYSDSAGSPGSLLAVSDEVAITTTTETVRDYTFSGANQIAITSGTPYWLGLMWSDPGTPSIVFSRDAVSNTRWERSASASPTWTYPNAPSSFGTPEGPFSGPADVWLDYTVPSATGPEPGRFLLSPR